MLTPRFQSRVEREAWAAEKLVTRMERRLAMAKKKKTSALVPDTIDTTFEEVFASAGSTITQEQEQFLRHMADEQHRRATEVQAVGSQPAKAQASELAQIIAAACDLVDLLLGTGAEVSLPAELVRRLTRPVTDKMRAYLDRRGKTSEDPWWVSKMRATVTRSDEKNVQSADETVFEVK